MKSYYARVAIVPKFKKIFITRIYPTGEPKIKMYKDSIRRYGIFRELLLSSHGERWVLDDSLGLRFGFLWIKGVGRVPRNPYSDDVRLGCDDE